MAAAPELPLAVHLCVADAAGPAPGQQLRLVGAPPQLGAWDVEQVREGKPVRLRTLVR